MLEKTALVYLVACRVIMAGASTAPPPDPETGLTSFRGCILVPTAWADGDSFRIERQDGTQHTVRLYGVDCFEWHVNDTTDARRLRSQRRYFGIARDDSQASIRLGKMLGEKAARTVVQLLARPFTIHTAFADGYGSGRHRRIYAFVTTHDGGDLASLLVKKGLARAYGICRTTPTGLSRDDYRSHLGDLELTAAKAGAGAWAHTDWERLPEERRAERDEQRVLALAFDHAPPARASVNPNTAPYGELMRLPGIGEVLAYRLMEARPFRRLDDMIRVNGIGPKRLEEMRPFLKDPTP